MSQQQKEIDFLSLSRELPEILIDFLCEHRRKKEKENRWRENCWLELKPNKGKMEFIELWI